MNDFSKRLRTVIDHSGYSLRQFAREIGISAGGLSGLLSGKTREPSQMFLHLLEYRFGVNRDWILKGKGAEYSDKLMVCEKEEASLLLTYRKLGKENKGTVQKIIKTLEQSDESS